MTPTERIVLDASVLLAAAGSPLGGSSAAIELLAPPTESVERTGAEWYEATVSAQILREALGNLRLKFDEKALVRFYTLLGRLRPSLTRIDNEPPELDFPSTVAAKDHHMLQACVAANASVCLTLDRRHLLTDDVRRRGIRRGIRFLTPGEFLAWERLREQEGT